MWNYGFLNVILRVFSYVNIGVLLKVKERTVNSMIFLKYIPCCELTTCKGKSVLYKLQNFYAKRIMILT